MVWTLEKTDQNYICNIEAKQPEYNIGPLL